MWRRLYGTGRFDLIAPARGGSLGFRSEFRAALVALCRRVSAPAHSRIVPLGNLRKLRPPCAPQPPTQVLRLPGESLEHSSDRHPAAVFKHSEPRRAPHRHDPPLTPSRPQPKPPPHNARQRNTGHPRGQPPRHKPLPKRGASAHNSAPAPVAVWYVRPSGHFARRRELLRSTAHYCIESLMTALSALFSVAPPPIPALLPRPPPLHATPTHPTLAATSTRRASPICK